MSAPKIGSRRRSWSWRNLKRLKFEFGRRWKVGTRRQVANEEYFLNGKLLNLLRGFRPLEG
jgi:hypothetical protein